MIRVTLQVTEGATSHRRCVTAPTIARALKMAGGKDPGRSVRVLFPIAPEDFFAGRTSAASEIPEPDAA